MNLQSISNQEIIDYCNNQFKEQKEISLSYLIELKGRFEHIENTDIYKLEKSKKFQLGILQTIEINMKKKKRERIENWVLVQKYLLSRTKNAGRTSAFNHCEFLGINPDGFTFFDKA